MKKLDLEKVLLKEKKKLRRLYDVMKGAEDVLDNLECGRELARTMFPGKVDDLVKCEIAVDKQYLLCLRVENTLVYQNT